LPSTEAQGLRLVALGGLGEFGLNTLVVQWCDHILLVDAGMMFPPTGWFGVESIVPDYSFLAEHREELRGILLTHGHEDHIGALPFALGATDAPVYGSRLTLGLARRRLRERGVGADLRELLPGRPEAIGPFRVHPIHVCHSIPGSLAFVIESPAGTLVVTGDFKLAPNAPPEERTDTASLARFGDQGVLALYSDSTNVEVPGHTPPEDDVLPALRQVFEETTGRVVVSCFATSLPRIQRIADLAEQAGRRLAFLGRRMEENCEVARDLGLLRLHPKGISSPSILGAQLPERTAYLVSGSQGEPLSALSQVSVDQHRDLSVGPGDTVVLSARTIPGNERAVSRLISNLYRRGCHVVHPGTARVHVSGHGGRQDLTELIRLVRPRYLVPAHGELRMLAQHARLGVEAGLDPERVCLCEDGEVLSLSPERAAKVARAATGRVALDRSGGDMLEPLVLRDRQRLGAHGVVLPVVVVDGTGRLVAPPEIVTRGFVDPTERAELIEIAAQLVTDLLSPPSSGDRPEAASTTERIRLELRRLFRKRLRRRPMVVPVVLELGSPR